MTFAKLLHDIDHVIDHVLLQFFSKKKTKDRKLYFENYAIYLVMLIFLSMWKIRTITCIDEQETMNSAFVIYEETLTSHAINMIS